MIKKSMLGFSAVFLYLIQSKETHAFLQNDLSKAFFQFDLDEMGRRL